jgi:hypothetical protein
MVSKSVSYTRLELYNNQIHGCWLQLCFCSFVAKAQKVKPWSRKFPSYMFPTESPFHSPHGFHLLWRLEMRRTAGRWHYHSFSLFISLPVAHLSQQMRLSHLSQLSKLGTQRISSLPPLPRSLQKRRNPRQINTQRLIQAHRISVIQSLSFASSNINHYVYHRSKFILLRVAVA